jgi:hypothetical protein
MGWTTEETRFDPRKVTRYFLFSKAYVPSQVPTQHRIPFDRSSFPPAGKGLELEPNHSLSPSSDVNNEWICTNKPSSLSHICKVCTWAIFWTFFTSFFRRFILSTTRFLGHLLFSNTGVHTFDMKQASHWRHTNSRHHSTIFFFVLATWQRGFFSPLVSCFEKSAYPEKWTTDRMLSKLVCTKSDKKHTVLPCKNSIFIR